MPTPTNTKHTIFYCPFAYYYRIRLQTPAKLLSWCLIYPVVCAYFAAVAQSAITLTGALEFMLNLLAIFSLYELGYILNDTYATRRESSPTLRLSLDQQQYVYTHIRTIVGTRLGIALVCMLTLFAGHYTEPLWILTLLCICAILPIFLVYNAWRSHYNAWLYPILVCSRYIPLLLPYLCHENARLMLLLILTFPVVNGLERFSMPRYRYPLMRHLIPNEPAKTTFRATYYILLAIVLSAIYAYNALPLIELLPIYVMTLYRIALLVLTRHHTPQRYLQG